MEVEKLKLLKASLKYVPISGWSRQSLIAGAQELGWTSSAQGICSRGPVELVEYFIESRRLLLGEKRKSWNDFDQYFYFININKTQSD